MASTKYQYQLKDKIFDCPVCEYTHSESDMLMNDYEVPDFEGETLELKCELCSSDLKLEYTMGELEVSHA